MIGDNYNADILGANKMGMKAIYFNFHKTNEENRENASSTYRFLVNLLTVNFNIPLVPNIVAFISMISLSSTSFSVIIFCKFSFF